MAFASVGSFGTANSVASGTTLALTPTVTLEVGNLALLTISADNVGVGTSPNAEFGHKISNVTSVTDTGSNTWHKLGEVATNQAAAAGNAVALYYCIITTQLTTGSTVTVTFGAAITSKAASGWEYTMGGSALAVERIRFRGTAGADPPSMTLDDLPSREYLFFRARASETDDTTWTATTNFTGITNATADAGAAAVGSTANGEFRIVTSTSQTSDPTKVAVDGSDIFIALWEGAQSASGPWVVTGNTLQSGAATTTPPWPLGHEVDDIAILVCESNTAEAVTLTTANGFAEVTNSPQNATDTRLTVFWCRATSTSMASPVTNDPGDHINNHMYLIRGCHNSGNPWDVTAGDTGASSTAVTIPQVTTTVDRCLILWISTTGTDIAGDEFSAWGNSGSTRFEELDAINTTAGLGGGHGIAYGYKATAGATGTATATLATASGQGRMSIALKPQQSSGSTVNKSESITVTENKVVDVGITANKSESITVTEATSQLITSFVNVNDNISVSESVAVQVVNVVNVSDSITVTEATAQTVGTSQVAVSDNVTVSEAASELITSFIAKSESITVSEAVSVAVINVINVSDSITVTESAAAAVSTTVNVSDNVTITESKTVAISTAVSVSDSITVTEAASAQVVSFVSVSDGVTVTESVTVQATRAVSVSDTVTVTEAVTVGAVRAVNVSDNVAVSEAASATVSAPQINVSDGITVSESASVNLPIGDNLSVNVTDTITVSESYSVAVGASLVNVTDSVTLTESVAALVGVQINQSESVTVTEAVGALVGAQVVTSDSVTVTESVGVSLPAAGAFAVAVSENVTVTDASIVSFSGALLDETNYDAVVYIDRALIRAVDLVS